MRQAGSVDEAAVRVDPRNRLLHHYALRRLEAEAIRDAVLAVSGRLDPQLFGPPINPARAIGLQERMGFLEPGDPAEFILFEYDAETRSVRLTDTLM